MRPPSANSTAATSPSVAGDDARDAARRTTFTPPARRASSSDSVDADGVVEHDRELGGQLAEQRDGVEAHRVGDDLDDAPVADLVAVAERAVDDVRAPVLGEALDGGELVDQPGGGEHPPGDDRVAADEFDPEAVVVEPGRRAARDPVEDLAAVAADLVPADRRSASDGGCPSRPR